MDRFTEDEHEDLFLPGKSAKWTLNILDTDQRKLEKLDGEISSATLSVSGEQLLVRKESSFTSTTVENAYKTRKEGEKVSLSGLSYFVDTEAEWNQIFNDTWRWYRDFFYDPGMHGRDWKAMGERYRTYIPWLSSREELNWVLSQMVGELCVTHTYIGGGDMGPRQAPSSPVFTGWLGGSSSSSG